jgi:guanyl-specific ribonuclease Sa
MVHPWQVFPPDANYNSLVVEGTGPASTVASAASHAQLAGVLDSVVGSSVANMAATYGANWSGVGSVAAAGAHGGMNVETVGLAATVASKVGPLMGAAQAYTTASTVMYPSPVVWANRANEHADQLINPLVWGALTPDIVALNLHYGHMWATNASAGATYGAALRTAAVALLAPAAPAVSGASPAAAAAAAASLAETATIAGVQAGLSTTEQGAMAVLSPAAAAPTAAVGAVSAVASTVAAPASSTATAAQVQPMAAVAVPAPAVPAPSQAPVPATSGMFAAPPAAALITAPAPATTVAPPVQAPAIAAPAAAPGVTSFIKPADPFAAPPTAGRAASVVPGMLNAAALRGPVSTMPLTTTPTTVATAAQPLAYVPPDHPRPVPPNPRPVPPLPDSGDAHTLTPQPQPTQLLTPPPSPPQPASPPAPPQSGPPPSTGNGGPGGSGDQMPGTGLAGAPQAPPVPVPLDHATPVPSPPEPPSPGNPPLQQPDVSGWTLPQPAKDAEAAQNAYKDLEQKILFHNSHPPNPHDYQAVIAYNQEADYYNSWASQLQHQMGSWNVQYTPVTSANTADVPSWTQPAPPQQGPTGPQIPQSAQDTLKQIDQGKWPQSANAPGTKGGRPYMNGDEHLPPTDGSGKPITYQEWDVNPKVPGQDRGNERIVTGSDGSAWYSPDHYQTFQRLR